jgi:hypothetical protein
MKEHGFRDATVTPPGADGGIDIRSRHAVAQVKCHAKPVGLAEVQRLYGITESLRTTGVFFSSAGFTPKAREWADQCGSALLTINPVTPVNDGARRLSRKSPWRTVR